MKEILKRLCTGELTLATVIDHGGLNRIIVSYNTSFFKFRTSENGLFLVIGQMRGTETLGEQY